MAVYPGSFDPVTNGHIDVAKRALTVFGEVVIAVIENHSKKTCFTVRERTSMLKKALSQYGIEGVRVDSFEGLLVDYMKNIGAGIIVRGLRAVSDFEYEFQMALMNRKLSPDIETVFFMTDAKYAYLSSSIVKEVAFLGGDITPAVPASAAVKLMKKRSKYPVRLRRAPLLKKGNFKKRRKNDEKFCS
ncbi:pantetheine-phosphate adenylyltransferase [bacterium]|nr:pantetheine-phosphate adenylyltransferase [bacterium]MBU3956279.1 pantetheine-phosphate adenylyltransferase [bacterium]